MLRRIHASPALRAASSIFSLSMASLLAAGCSSSSGASGDAGLAADGGDDGSSVDASGNDSGSGVETGTDAGGSDSSTHDAGGSDASKSDAGGPDGSTGDSGSLDGSTHDAGDAGCEPVGGNAAAKRVIVFVWDGMRPDSIDATNTPNLAMLKAGGSFFSDNHSTYLTFTMMNSASFATGGFPGTTGFYGNTLWAPGATGKDSANNVVDFNQPAFTEDYAILGDLSAFYGNQLLLVSTLFQAAQSAGLKTAAIGKSGAAFLQDFEKGGIILDEKFAWPLSFVQELQAANQPLPALTPVAYAAGAVTLSGTNGNPTASTSKKVLADGTTSDPTDTSGNQYTAANAYMMQTYLTYVLPVHHPDLSLIWFRNPDSTEHNYGPGSANYADALKAQDTLLGNLLSTLNTLGLSATTDVIVVSDHGHSSVSGPASLFPLRDVVPSDAGAGASVGGTDATNGYSVSGDVRLADLLTRAGFTDVYDGSGCTYDPVLSGIKADGTPVYPVQTDTASGTVCGKANAKYTTPSYKVPATLPTDAVVIAANGGSDYLYVPEHSITTVTRLVSYLQTREEIGAIFVASAYGAIPGTLPLTTIKVESTAFRTPDVVVSYAWDDQAVIAGKPGIEFESAFNDRGMHGTFGTTDVHNTLVGSGPDFRAGFVDALPSGNVDVAPTIAWLLGLSLPKADGRPLYEGLVHGLDASGYSVTPKVVSSTEVTGLTMQLPTSPTNSDVDTTVTKYRIDLKTKDLAVCGKSYTYFDSAKGVRE